MFEWCGEFYILKESELYIMSAGILDIESQLNFANQVFIAFQIKQKPNRYGALRSV